MKIRTPDHFTKIALLVDFYLFYWYCELVDTEHPKIIYSVTADRPPVGVNDFQASPWFETFEEAIVQLEKWHAQGFTVFTFSTDDTGHDAATANAADAEADAGIAAGIAAGDYSFVREPLQRAGLGDDVTFKYVVSAMSENACLVHEADGTPTGAIDGYYNSPQLDTFKEAISKLKALKAKGFDILMMSTDTMEDGEPEHDCATPPPAICLN